MTTREEFGKLVDNFEKQFETVCIRGSYNIIGQDPDTARAALLAAYDAQTTSIADWSKSAGYYHNLSVAYAQKIQELRAALQELILRAADGAWHSPLDCETEGWDDCELCAAICKARAALKEQKA